MKKLCSRNLLALILKPKVSDVKYFPLELIKPNGQLNFSVTVLFNNEEVGGWSLLFIIDFWWWPFWLIEGFFSTGCGRWFTVVVGISEGGDLTEGFGLN